MTLDQNSRPCLTHDSVAYGSADSASGTSVAGAIGRCAEFTPFISGVVLFVSINHEIVANVPNTARTSNEIIEQAKGNRVRALSTCNIANVTMTSICCGQVEMGCAPCSTIEHFSTRPSNDSRSELQIDFVVEREPPNITPPITKCHRNEMGIGQKMSAIHGVFISAECNGSAAITAESQRAARLPSRRRIRTWRHGRSSDPLRDIKEN